MVGGLASGTVLLAGGLENVEGIASGGVVMNGGRENVFAGGTARGLTISNGGYEVVYAGGVESGTTISSGGVVADYGSSIGDTILSGGTLYVLSGAAVNGATVSGGLLNIRSGGTAGTSQIDFSSAGGTLQLDDSVHFSGAIGNFHDGGFLDLRDIAFGGSTTLAYADSGTSGTLTVTDGTHTAQILMLGAFVEGNFTKQSDGNGGTLITDPPIVDQYSLYNPHA
jgi:autotransporter passenger strand-loop-strand repeat protein